jgi:hypothetical protein
MNKEIIKALPKSKLMQEAILRIMQDRMMRSVFYYSEKNNPEGTLHIWKVQENEQ